VARRGARQGWMLWAYQQPYQESGF
jgi:hypothetical protein